LFRKISFREWFTLSLFCPVLVCLLYKNYIIKKLLAYWQRFAKFLIDLSDASKGIIVGGMLDNADEILSRLGLK